MARNKKNRKKKPTPSFVKIKPENYIRKHARKLPIYECLIGKNWRTSKFSPIIVTRQKKSGDLVMGNYIVDLQCLGVKDATYIANMEMGNYQDYIAQMKRGMRLTFEKIDPNLCFNIIYGAVEFAEDCGFAPHKDFDVAEYILEDVTKLEYVEVPLGGDDGKPFFISGPYDDSSRILATLLKTKGEGNFHFQTIMDPDSFSIDRLKEDNDIVERYFPEAIIEKKLNSLQDEVAMDLLSMQLNTAVTILVTGEGDINRIKELYEEDDDFFDDVFEEVLLTLEESRDKEDGELDLEIEQKEVLEEMTSWVIEKIIEHNGPHFLWEADYEPAPKILSHIEIQQLTDEEWNVQEEKKMYYMTNEKRQEYIFSKFFLRYTADYDDKEIMKKEVQDTIKTAYFEGLKTEVFTDKWDEEIEEYTTYIADKVLADLSRALS